MLEQEKKAILIGLNEPQRRAVTTTRGPVLILAGPGSGKTRVITHRIAYMVQEEQISPWRILAVTFTNKAAKEMRERLEKLVGINESKEMTIGTFHAICARVLRSEADSLLPFGLNKSFAIFDTGDQTTLIKQAIKQLALDEKQYKPASMQALISRAKNDMYSSEQMAEHATKYIEEVASRVYKVYQKLLRANNGVDFDDLLMLTERLWRHDPVLLEKYQRRWRYLHVDEFQDCNLLQYKLVHLLAYGTTEQHNGFGNICVVGDDDQMIYTWRGASTETVLRFERDFPEVETIILDQNYRSTQTILDAAQGVVRRNSFRKDKKLWTEQGKGEKVVLHQAYNEEEEGLFTAREILRLLGRGDVESRRDVAVMYRTNAQSRAIEEQFLNLNIPYKVIGSRKFYERKEIKDMIAYLRLLANPTDDLSLQRIINVPNRKIGAKTLGELQQWATAQNIPQLTAVQRINEHPTLGKAAKIAIESFGKLIANLAESLHELSLPELLDRIAEQSGYGPELRAMPEDELDRWANVLELRHVAENYSEIESSVALELFLENVALVGGADTAQTSEDGSLVREENTDSVTLITLHAAKGLEFPVVFIVGMDEGSLPHSRSVGKVEELEEERRLAYVGFTRAMKRLYLVRAKRRSFWGETHTTEPSRFLDDIPVNLISRADTKNAASGSGLSVNGTERAVRKTAWDEDDFNQDTFSENEGGRVFGSGIAPKSTAPKWTQPTSAKNYSTPPNIPPSTSSKGKFSQPAQPEKPKGPQFTAGQRVRHGLFGEGVILKSEMEYGTEFVEVQFQGRHGKKRLSVDFAKLEKV